MKQENQHLNNFSKEAPQEAISSSESNSTNKTFFCSKDVKRGKNEALKRRLQTLILAKGMSEPEFFHKLEITRQHWYSLSWGLQNIPESQKIKIAQLLGVDSLVIFSAEKTKVEAAQPSVGSPNLQIKKGDKDGEEDC